MKKTGMAVFALLILGSACAFFLLNNQGHCNTIDDTSCVNSDFLLSGTGLIQEYSVNNLNSAFERGDRVGLYFKANWCGNCKLLEEDLIARGIPAGSTVLTVDFDEAFELRKQYEVMNLHTLVVIDHTMKMLHKDSSGEYEKIIDLLK